MYKTFTEWKNGYWLEDGEPRKEAYTKDELLLVEMGWKYGFDAGKAQQADRIAELEKQGEPVAWWTGKYEDEGEDFMFPNTRQAHIDHPQSATYKFFPIPLYTAPQTKPLSDEEIEEIAKQHLAAYAQFIGAGEVCYEGEIEFARAIEERHGIK